MSGSNYKYICFFLFFSSIVATCQTDEASLIKKVDGFSHPESVVFDEQRDVLYISNIGEDKDGDGFISKLGTGGEIIELEWITGLNDPKGLLVHNDKLYVTDVTEMVEMDIEKEEITKKTPIEGAEFLNDITVDAVGNIFISDSRQSIIYLKMNNGSEFTEYLNTEELEYPNGLLAHKDDMFVAAWGTEDASGNVLKIDLDTREIEKISKERIGNLDGIQLIKDNEFYISDWATGDIYKISETGEQQHILSSEESAGDILFLEDSNKLILPMNFQNSVWWYQID